MSQSQDESQTDSSQSWRDALGPPPPMGTTKVSLPFGKTIFLKLQTLFFFMLVIMDGIHKMLVGIANREDPYQAASSEAV